MDEGEKKVKVFVDSDVAVLAFAFLRDKRHRDSEELVKRLRGKLFMTFWNFLEVLGVMSYQLPKEKVEYFSSKLKQVFNVVGTWPAQENVFGKVLLRMRAGDALTACILESEKADIFITWNTKDFLKKIRAKVLNPTEFMSDFL